MVRLPTPGGDDGNWGGILNDYLSASHNTDGTLKSDSVYQAVRSYLDSSVTADAAGTQNTLLAFDQTGTRNAKSVPLYVSDAGDLALGSSETASRLTVNDDRAFQAGNTTLIDANWLAEAAANNAAPRALRFRLELLGEERAGAFSGVTLDLVNSANATVSSTTGVSVNHRLNTDDIGSTYGYRSVVLVDALSTGLISKNISFEARPVYAGGRADVVDKSYGIWIQPQKSVSVTTGYGVYQNGTSDINFIAGKTGFGTNTPHSSVQVAGSMALQYVTTSGSVTLTDAHMVVEVTNTAHVVTLPTAVGITGRVYTVINVAGGNATVNTTAGEVVGNTRSATSLALASGATAQLISNGTAWRQIS